MVRVGGDGGGEAELNLCSISPRHSETEKLRGLPLAMITMWPRGCPRSLSGQEPLASGCQVTAEEDEWFSHARLLEILKVWVSWISFLKFIASL